jgi:phosphate transport system substrate-binding protein
MFRQKIAVLTIAATSILSQAQSSIPVYQPVPVTVPDSATYLTRDGKIQIMGNDGWEAMMSSFDELFLKTHPDFTRQFHTVMKGSSVAIPALETGVSALSPMARAMWEDDRFAFHRFHGYDPLDIHIGYAAFAPRTKRKSPPWVYVNAKNPLAGLTVEQIQQIFTEGAPGGTITRWSQVGVKGAWANRAIHVYGLDQGSGGTLSFRSQFLEDRTFIRTYEALAKPVDIAQAVADDPYSIALLGFFDAGTNSNVKSLPVAQEHGAAFALPTYENVAADKTPFPAYLHIYVNREPGKPMDLFVKEYVKMLLSEQGQKIIATQTDTDEGYVPLNPDRIAAELRKLD